MEAVEHLRIIEKNSIVLILEFLDSYNLKKSVETLMEEASSRKMPVPESDIIARPRIKKENVPVILSLMKSLNSSAFFEGWESLIPKEIQLLPEYKKLTIFLYIFFATLPQRKIASKPVGGRNKTHNADVEQPSPNSFKSRAGTNDPIAANEIEFSENCERRKRNVQLKKEKDSLDFNSVENGIAIKNVPSSPEIEGFLKLEKMNKTSECSTDRTLSSDAAGMEMLKNFLSTRGYDYAKELEFLPYFALPFVDNPKDHPLFSGIFKEGWIKDLESMLIQFLTEYSYGESVVPELMKICAPGNETLRSETAAKSALDEYVKRYKELKRKFHKLRRDHQNIVGIASELATALENSVRGDAVDLKAILENCVNIFPDLFLKNSPNISNDSYLNGAISANKYHNWNQLDVARIKKDLSTGNVKSKLLLLQSIRWYLMQKRNEERELAVSWIIRHDILGLKEGCFQEDLNPNSVPHPVQQAVARLVNGLASLKNGRDYLVSSPDLIKSLVDALKLSCRIDPITCDMLIASLQKLSLRTTACDIMLSNKMIEWLLEQMEADHFYGYSLVYSTSLLMNLLFRTEHNFWYSHIKQIIHIMIKLLKSRDNEVLEFVFGILYILLRDDSVNDEFRKSELLSLLKEKLENKADTDTIAKRQMTTLISLHQREITPDAVTTMAEEEMEDDLDDPDKLEYEIDAGDPLPRTQTGEEYLNQHYRLIFLPKGVVNRTSPTQDIERKISIRPTTPQSCFPPLEFGSG